MEDCATDMSAPQGCTDNKAVIGIFKEALKEKVGADRFRMWFHHVVDVALVSGEPATVASNIEDGYVRVESTSEANAVLISVRGQFALDRLRNNYLGELRGAACQSVGRRVDVLFTLHDSKAQQVDLPFGLGEETDLSEQTEGESSRTYTPNHSVNERLLVDGKRSKPMDRVDAAHETRPATRNRSASVHRPSRTNARGGVRRSRSLGNLLQSTSLKDSSASKNGRSGRRPIPQRARGQSDLVQLDFASLGDAEAFGSTQARETIHANSAGSHSSDSQTASSGSGKTQPIDRIEPKMHSANFIPGSSNRLAHTAMIMACQDPSTASPLFLYGPTGTGKTHLLHAIADQLRRRFRLRRVMNLSAEQFTNDFITSVGNSGITAFRRRYRDVDALLVDDVQFLGSKKATLREMLYTVETLSGQGKPLIFAGAEAPSEIDGLSSELSGRMASGLVCQLQPLDSEIREKLLRQWITERCQLEVPDLLINAIAPMLAGDGRVISGIVNVLNTLQRMLGRSPSLQELQQFAGQLLRSNQPVATLGLIESAVCQAFHLPPDSLRSKSQTRAVSGPRKLAMYLSRQLTPSAYSEIGHHFGGRSHSTAISAEQHVKNWIKEGAAIGRGVTALSARDALDRIETLLRTG